MSVITVLGNAVALFTLWLFVTAGYSKLQSGNRAFYLRVFDGYGITSRALAESLIYVVGLLEIVTGLLVMAPPLRTLGLAMAAVMLLGYLLLMAYQLRQGKASMECGCSGPDSGIQLSPLLLLRNVILIGLLPLALLAVPGWSTSLWLLSVATALMLVLTSLSADQLLRNFQKIDALKAL